MKSQRCWQPICAKCDAKAPSAASSGLGSPCRRGPGPGSFEQLVPGWGGERWTVRNYARNDPGGGGGGMMDTAGGRGETPESCPFVFPLNERQGGTNNTDPFACKQLAHWWFDLVGLDVAFPTIRKALWYAWCEVEVGSNTQTGLQTKETKELQ